MCQDKLPVMDVATRVGRLRELFAEAGCDALLVTDLHNIRYLTGFTGSAGTVLVTADRLVLATDGRYGLQSAHQLESSGVEAELVVGNMAVQREGLVGAVEPGARVGLESDDITWSRYLSIVDTWFDVSRVVATGGLIEKLRAVKDVGEIARIERACDIADQALAACAPLLATAVTERHFALELELEMRKRGAAIAWSPIVASGSNGAEAHHTPTERVIGEGELVVVDFGCEIDGYRSDMTRMLCRGPLRDDLSRQMYDVVRSAQQASLDLMQAGSRVDVIDRACREVIAATDEAWAATMTHGSGHGVGLDNHEWPILHAAVTDSLVAGQVITIEPGVYIAGHGGVRIEDTVLITDDGSRCLTKTNKDLIHL